MYGTLAGALAARKVEFDRSTFAADVLGTIEGEKGKTIRITRIHVNYEIALKNPDQRPLVERALEVHAAGCPAHESVKGAIEVTWSADIKEG